MMVINSICGWGQFLLALGKSRGGTVLLTLHCGRKGQRHFENKLMTINFLLDLRSVATLTTRLTVITVLNLPLET
jgi:hypothetical protein